ncbi:MAG: glycosyltransferase [Candidatus Gottesmanbacteria bacterium]
MDNTIGIKTLCITGGHLTPALAVIEEIQEQKKPWNILFVGREHTSQGNKKISDEKRIIENLHIPFISITAGRLQRQVSLSSIIELFMVPIGCMQACLFCLKYRPDCILSFGGYIGLPMSIAGWLFGIPTVIHEQTHALGLANRIASQLAASILLTFPDTKSISKECHTAVIGLPIRKAFFNPKKHPSFAIFADKPILYITGGTTGAVSLNDLIFPSIHTLVSSCVVVHQTGQVSYEKALEVKKQLKKEDQKRYIPFSYIESEDVAWIMHHMTLLVGRSGANTTMETAALQKPAVFVPLPWAGSDEQKQNAQWYAKTGHVTIVDQRTTTQEILLETILSVLHRTAKEKKIKKIISASSAAASIVRETASLL